MIIPKLTSSKEVVEKFYNSTGTSTEIIDDEVKLNIVELFDLIEYPLMYLPKIIGYKQDPRYDFTNYKVPLPCDFFKLYPSGISVDGNPVRWRSNSFHYLMDGDCCSIDNLNRTGLELFTDQFGNEFSPSEGSTTADNSFRDVTFDINNDEITFNIKSGKVCMAYWAYPVDNQGFLMIPDDSKFKRACTDYLIWKNDYILWRQQLISDKVYQESRNNKDWAISSVSSHFKLPDIEQLEGMKSSLIRLIPRINSYAHQFRDLGILESRTTGSYSTGNRR